MIRFNIFGLGFQGWGLTQQKWRRQRVHTMWLQPPLRWMRAPHPPQGLVWRASQVSFWPAASACIARTSAPHSRTCGVQPSRWTTRGAGSSQVESAFSDPSLRG